MPEDKIILAIDGLNLNEAVLLLKSCPDIKWIKVGLELFSKEGPKVINIFKQMGKKIFLDLKFHDIPNTMKSACYEVSKYGVDMISVHSLAGARALKLSKKASLEGAKESNVISTIVFKPSSLSSELICLNSPPLIMSDTVTTVKASASYSEATP